MTENNCERCGSKFLPYEKIIHLQNNPVEIICSECFNAEAAMLINIDLEELNEKTIEVSGKGKKKHLFYICRTVLPMGILLEAIEIQGEEQKGYKIQVRGDVDCNQKELYDKLIKKIKKALSKKYIRFEKTAYTSGNFIKDDKVVGRIEGDEKYDDRVPMLVIDGKDYTWEEFGKMLMTFEGFDFKMKILEGWEDEE